MPIERKIIFQLLDANAAGLVFGVSYNDDPLAVSSFGIDMKDCVNVCSQDFKAKFFQQFDKAMKTLAKHNPVIKTNGARLVHGAGHG